MTRRILAPIFHSRPANQPLVFPAVTIRVMKTFKVGLRRFPLLALVSVPGFSRTLLQVKSAECTTATAVAFVINGFVVSINVTFGGTSYTEPPEVSITGGGGSNAVAQAVISDGSVTAIHVLNAGSGYISTPTVTIAPPCVTWIDNIQMAPMLTIMGSVGATNQIQYTENLQDTNAWTVLANFVLSSSPYLFVDTSAPPAPRRFYRVVRPSGMTVTNPQPDWLVWIPAGSFLMGSPAGEQDCVDNEGRQTAVTVSQGFWMSKHETTQGQYLAVMGTDSSYFGGDTNRPVEQVSWHDATNFCGRFNDQERLAGRLPATFTCCRPRRSGNMPAAPAPRIDFTLGTIQPTPCLAASPGMAARAGARTASV